MRVRERNKAGGEEARSKTRKAWIKRRGRRKKSNNSEEQQKSVRKEGRKTRQTRTNYRRLLNLSFGISAFLRRGKLTGRWNEERTVMKTRESCKTKKYRRKR